MTTYRTAILITLCLVLFAGISNPAAAERETTWVSTFNREFVNWADPHVATFTFPPADLYSAAYCRITIGCPNAPGDCDPWDRFANIKVRDYAEDSTYVEYEIARFITPYDITYAGGPYTCSWIVDVTDYQTLLHDGVTLVLFIDSWIGGNKGWLITADFEMIHGIPEQVPFAISRLWSYGYIVYGDPDNPPENYLSPITVGVPADAVRTKFRAFSTGHGFLNTDNAAEFSHKWQAIHVDDNVASHVLWRSDCESNPCSPQQGTWQYDRAGWCPGDKADAWDVDVTAWVTQGESSSFVFALQPYVNYCRPSNPDCVESANCECAGDAYYRFEGQVVFYREPDLSVVPETRAAPATLRLLRNPPNPANPGMVISYELSEPGEVVFSLFDVTGALVRTVQQRHADAGLFSWTWDGRDDAGRQLATGVYLCELRHGDARVTTRLLTVR
jgi:hypothetical protein